jgi:hypothetical protein
MRVPTQRAEEQEQQPSPTIRNEDPVSEALSSCASLNDDGETLNHRGDERADLSTLLAALKKNQSFSRTGDCRAAISDFRFWVPEPVIVLARPSCFSRQLLSEVKVENS